MSSIEAAAHHPISPAPAVLVVGPSWVGDMVMAQSLFRILKQRDPAPRVDVLAPGWTRPLLERMPEVDEAVEMPVGHGTLALRQRRRLGLDLRLRRYGQALVLPNSWKSALIPYWASIPRRSGWRGEFRYGLLNDIRRLDPRRLPTTVQRFAALAMPDAALDLVPIPRLEIKALAAQQALRDVGLRKSARHRVLALCPGAEFGPSKRWPAESYGRLARDQVQRGWDVWLFGSDRDVQVCTEVNRCSGGVCADLSGRTTLGQAVDLLSLADRVVTNDSGLMHVAAALGHPLVAIFGSTDPAHTPPLSHKAKVVYLGLDCSPCFRRECPFGHLDCLRGLTMERVLAALDSLPR